MCILPLRKIPFRTVNVCLCLRCQSGNGEPLHRHIRILQCRLLCILRRSGIAARQQHRGRKQRRQPHSLVFHAQPPIWPFRESSSTLTICAAVTSHCSRSSIITQNATGQLSSRQ